MLSGKKGLILTGSEDLADSIEVAQFALSASHEVSGTDALMRVVLDSDCVSVGYRQIIKVRGLVSLCTYLRPFCTVIVLMKFK